MLFLILRLHACLSHLRIGTFVCILAITYQRSRRIFHAAWMICTVTLLFHHAINPNYFLSPIFRPLISMGHPLLVRPSSSLVSPFSPWAIILSPIFRPLLSLGHHPLDCRPSSPLGIIFVTRRPSSSAHHLPGPSS